MSKPIIALTGRRQVGKSHVATHLVENHDFIRLHPFNPGKAGCRAMYVQLGIDPEKAFRMTDHDLKDVPMSVFPVRDSENVHFDYKEMARAFVLGYLDYLDVASPDELQEMVYGRLKDVKHPKIPANKTTREFVSMVEAFMKDELWDPPKQGEIRSPKTQFREDHPDATPGHYTSRHVMERLGQFLGVTLGPEWTIMAEISRAQERYGDEKGKVIESIVYEAGDIRHFSNLFIVRVSADREVPIESPESDKVVQSIKEDASFHNKMLGMEEMGEDFDEAMEKQGVNYAVKSTFEP